MQAQGKRGRQPRRAPSSPRSVPGARPFPFPNPRAKRALADTRDRRHRAEARSTQQVFCKPPAALPAPATSDPRHRALFLPRPLPVTPGALPAPALPPGLAGASLPSPLTRPEPTASGTVIYASLHHAQAGNEEWSTSSSPAARVEALQLAGACCIALSLLHQRRARGESPGARCPAQVPAAAALHREAVVWRSTRAASAACPTRVGWSQPQAPAVQSSGLRAPSWPRGNALVNSEFPG